MSPKLHHTLKNLFRIFLILFGNALYSLAVVAFILPSGIITGGTTGLALASAHWFHTPITAFVLCFNILTFLLGFLCSAGSLPQLRFCPHSLPDLARILAAVPGAVLPDGGRNALHDPRRNDDRCRHRHCHPCRRIHRRHGHPALI